MTCGWSRVNMYKGQKAIHSFEHDSMLLQWLDRDLQKAEHMNSNEGVHSMKHTLIKPILELVEAFPGQPFMPCYRQIGL